MKKISLLFLFAFSFSVINAQATFDALTLSNPYPKASQSLSFTFNQKMSPLINEKNAEIAVYQFTNKGLIVKEPVLKKNGSVYSGTVMIDSNANTIAFGISSGDVKDNNSGKGYIVPVYDKNNDPVKEYYASAGPLYSGYGEFLFGMANEPKKNLELQEAGLKKYPELANDLTFYNGYMSAISSVYNKEAQPLIIEKLNVLESKPVLSEGEYNTLSTWYSRYKMKSKADSLSAVMRQKFPAGFWVFNNMMTRFSREKDPSKKLTLYDSLLVVMPAYSKNENLLNRLKSQMAEAYNIEKNTAMFAKWSQELPMSARASMYNDMSWGMAEKNENMQEAKKMSEEATMWAKMQMSKPTEKQPVSMTAKQWKLQREENYAMYADTYAFIMYNLGEYKTGLPYAKDGAIYKKLKDPEYNERYAMLLEKVAPVAEAKPVIEDMVKAGKATPKTKDALKSLYTKENKNDAGFAAYMVKLEESAKAQATADLAKTMVSNPAPKFALKDWEGKEVTLESLKGKVVVVDFWATWCGPCIASMPGMKKAQEKLAARDDVKFLFVDTWENVDNKLDNSKEFMKKKNYPFYVLMDNEDKMVADFGVSGIPTKFILDRNGKIRFKSVGFGGSTDALADEVVTMVEMAGK